MIHELTSEHSEIDPSLTHETLVNELIDYVDRMQSHPQIKRLRKDAAGCVIHLHRTWNKLSDATQSTIGEKINRFERETLGSDGSVDIILAWGYARFVQEKQDTLIQKAVARGKRYHILQPHIYQIKQELENAAIEIITSQEK